MRFRVDFMHVTISRRMAEESGVENDPHKLLVLRSCLYLGYGWRTALDVTRGESYAHYDVIATAEWLGMCESDVIVIEGPRE